MSTPGRGEKTRSFSEKTGPGRGSPGPERGSYARRGLSTARAVHPQRHRQVRRQVIFPPSVSIEKTLNFSREKKQFSARLFLRKQTPTLFFGRNQTSDVHLPPPRRCAPRAHTRTLTTLISPLHGAPPTLIGQSGSQGATGLADTC